MPTMNYSYLYLTESRPIEKRVNLQHFKHGFYAYAKIMSHVLVSAAQLRSLSIHNYNIIYNYIIIDSRGGGGIGNANVYYT